MDLSQAVTFGGASIIVGILVEVIKRLFGWDDATVKRFGPVVAIIVGVVLVEVLLFAQGSLGDSSAIAAGAITGLLAGAAASGLYDAATSKAGVA